MKSVEVREQMANALTLDLIGPVSGLAAGAHLEREILPGSSTPSRWYLTGFLAPFESNIEDKSDEDSGEQMDLISQAKGGDDESAPEASSAPSTEVASGDGARRTGAGGRLDTATLANPSRCAAALSARPGMRCP